MDVYQTKDNELVVIHDLDVDRTTNGSGPIANLSFNELRQLDAGNGAQIPTLDEVLDLVDAQCGVNVELKGANTARAVNKLLDERCLDGWSSDLFLISSFIF